MEVLDFRSVSEADVRDILAGIPERTDNARLNVVQFEKYLPSDGGTTLWYGCFAGGSCASLAVLKRYRDDGLILLAEIQSILTGYGKPLLENILSRAANIWWCADPDGGERLADYYRQFAGLGIREHLIRKSKWLTVPGPEYAFYKADPEHERVVLDTLEKADMASSKYVPERLSRRAGRGVYQTEIDSVLAGYRELFGFDLSYMEFRVSPQPVYRNGEPCYEMDPEQCGGDWTELGFIRLNPDMQSVMNRYGVERDGASGINRFVKIIIAHELAHELWNNVVDDGFKRGVLAKAADEGFGTVYLDTVQESKLPEETFCEYMANAVVGPE